MMMTMMMMMMMMMMTMICAGNVFRSKMLDLMLLIQVFTSSTLQARPA